MRVPQSMTSTPIYSFVEQFKAMFLRQFYMTTRNWSAVLMIILPVLFNFLSVYIGKHFLDNLKNLMEEATKKIVEDNGGNYDDTKDAMNIDERFIFPMQMTFFTILIVQSYSMNSSIYVNTPVLEREHSLKYALNVMGCRPLPYWLGTLAFDFLAYFSTFLVFFYSLVHYEVDFIQPYLSKFFFTMVAFGFALIVFAYLCGFLFSSSNSAFKSFPLIAFFIGYNLPFIANFFVKTFAPSY